MQVVPAQQGGSSAPHFSQATPHTVGGGVGLKVGDTDGTGVGDVVGGVGVSKKRIHTAPVLSLDPSLRGSDCRAKRLRLELTNFSRLVLRNSKRQFTLVPRSECNT